MTVTNPRLLFLHGFLQNAKVFSEKSSGIRKLLKKSNVECDYIDGPVELEREDLPFELDDEKWQACLDTQVNKAWFYHSDVSSELNLDAAIKYVADYIKDNGPYDGIVGFSQGAAVAAIVTNRIRELVPKHPDFKLSLLIASYSFTEPDPAHEGLLRIAEKFQNDFKPRSHSRTRMLFIYGSADQAVPATRAQYLANLYKKALGPEQVKEFEHQGGHMVPNKKDIIRPVVDEINEALAA
ncbi:hypothetical protein HG536_0E03540 [Torulaspora globosa]|uniref:Serine hydrolase domain-containing protein n=1 Tax=Torulaspora globosa TaxID=48254 RepID=A0A7G3ZIV7_9SACH|nr:uncharacterized protein HG536_0E03540 [Torulaspora globosa]QLL33443.1 hypothetical protein HG536_0E03540 [Torulaspora globosa]